MDAALWTFLWNNIIMPLVVIPIVTMTVAYPFVRKRSRKAKRLAVMATLLLMVCWETFISLRLTHWRLDGGIAFLVASMLLLVACTYPILVFWDRQRERAVAAAGSPHTPQEEKRSQIVSIVAVLFLVVFVGAIIWSAWH